MLVLDADKKQCDLIILFGGFAVEQDKKIASFRGEGQIVVGEKTITISNFTRVVNENGEWVYKHKLHSFYIVGSRDETIDCLKKMCAHSTYEVAGEE